MFTLAQMKMLAIIASVAAAICCALIARGSKDERPQWTPQQRKVVQSTSSIVPDKNYIPK